MDIAVPANLRCGQPDGDAPPPTEPDWAPLTYTFGGVWEIEPHALEPGSARRRVQIVDVREPREFTDALGHIHGARLLPLAQLPERIGEIDRGAARW